MVDFFSLRFKYAEVNYYRCKFIYFYFGGTGTKNISTIKCRQVFFYGWIPYYHFTQTQSAGGLSWLSCFLKSDVQSVITVMGIYRVFPDLAKVFSKAEAFLYAIVGFKMNPFLNNLFYQPKLMVNSLHGIFFLKKLKGRCKSMRGMKHVFFFLPFGEG